MIIFQIGSKYGIVIERLFRDRLHHIPVLDDLAFLQSKNIDDSFRARIRDATTVELRALPYLPASDFDVRAELQRTRDSDEWSLASRREAVLKAALSGEGPAKERMKAAAVALGMSSQAIY